MATHFRACNLCEAICGLAIEHEGGRVLSIRGDEADPLGRGHLCPKALGLKDIHEDPDRLRRPLVRRGGGFEEVGWEEALDEAGARIRAVRRRHGRDAVAYYQGNPIVHNYGSMLYGMVVMPAVLRSRARFSANSVDALPRLLVSLRMYGSQAVVPVPDLDRCAHLLVIGANPMVSNGSLMTAPDLPRRLRAIRARGGKIVVIDPRRSETAAVADEHHFIRPGGDAALLLGLLHVLFAEGLARPGRLAGLLRGLDEVRSLAARFPPERVARSTGIGAEAIRRIARELAASGAAAVYGRIGVSVQEFGALATWLIEVVNAVTGNLDRAGGAMFPKPAVDLAALAARVGQRGSFGRWHSRVRGLPEFSGELPTAALAEEIETPGAGRIRALITNAGNPVLSAPNGARLERALPTLEAMVCVDLYLNETTRHAHVILPPTSALEHEHYDLALLALAVRNTARHSTALFEPPPGALHDWQIFAGLLSRIVADGPAGRLLGAAIDALSRRATPERLIDLLLRRGPYRLSLAKLREAPHGVDLGPLEPRLPEVLYTRDRRIDLAPADFVADAARLEAWIDAGPVGSLSLIGRRDLRSNNSWMHNSERLVKGPPRCTLQMHPDDARARGLSDGATVRVRSRVGEVVAPLEVTADLMPGVVSLPHGWGHGRAGTRLAVAGRRPGVSVNDITDDMLVDALSGNAAVNGVPVTVSGM